MRDRELTDLFLRFRDRGETAALAAVFDRTAPELLRVARYLARGRADADDLLQATFLAAIEGAAAFEPSRPLEPWLFGILVHLAAAARRRAGRPLDAARLQPAGAADPGAAAEARELADEVARAVAQLPARYRSVVLPRLADGARGVDLAAKLGRRPGVVRAQLHRGLELLRRALPAGLLSALVAAATARSSLAAVRAKVLTAGAAAAGPGPSAAAAGSIAAGSIGGWLVSKKIAGVAALLALAAGTAFWAGSREAPGLAQSGALPAVETAADGAPPREREPAAAGVEREPAAVSAAVAASAPADAPPARYTAELAGIRGRLLEADRSAAAGRKIAFLEVHPAEFEVTRAAVFEGGLPEPHFELAEGVTAADGAFVLRGARLCGVHLLAIDLGGPRAALRVLERSLVPGADVDLGDVVLDPVVAFRGRVVGEDGSGIGSARVRAVDLPFPVAALGLHHLRSDSTVFAAGLSGAFAPIDVPAWVRTWFDRLPVPTVSTAADGSFELPGVARGLATLLVDAPGFAATAFGPTPTGSGAARDVGAIELLRGRTVSGRVVDEVGAPVAGAEVRGGAVVALDRIAIANAATVTDAAGHYELGHVPADVDVVVAARRRALEPWAMLGPVDGEDVPDLALPLRATLRVQLERTDGGSLLRAEVRATPVSGAMARMRRLVPAADLLGAAVDVGAGLYEIAGLPLGTYAVAARADGCAATEGEVEVTAEGADLRLELAAGWRFSVRAIDRATGEPVSWASAALFEDGEDFLALASGRTGESGIADLGPIPPRASATSTGLLLRVDHPGFAQQVVRVAAEDDAIEVALDTGGGVRGRLRMLGEAPSGPCTVMVVRDEEWGADRVLPWLGLSDERGDFQLLRLPPGEYRCMVYEQIFAGNPVPAFAVLADGGRDALASEDFRVELGRITELGIDLRPVGKVGAGAVRGRVTKDGEPMAGCEISVSAPGMHASVQTDSAGRYSVESLTPGRIHLSLFSREVDAANENIRMVQLCSEQLALGVGEQRQLDFAFESARVAIRVRARGTGEPVAGAEIQLHGVEAATARLFAPATTDGTGRVEVEVLRPGRYLVQVEHSTAGVARAEVAARRGAVETLELELDPGVPCAGTIAFAGSGVPPQETYAWSMDFIQVEGSVPREFRHTMVEWGASTFRVAGLAAGTYDVVFTWGERQSAPVRIQLGAAGDGNLALTFAMP